MHWGHSSRNDQREHMLHARYQCIKPRYPYFWNEMLKIPDEVKQSFTEKHKAHIYEMFGKPL